jgi:exonuclease SbcC
MICDPRGSVWRRWDLHFHTPTSYDYLNKGVDAQTLVDCLIAAGIKVVAVTDHHVIDVHLIHEMQRLGGNELTVLPGIELRSELGGSEHVHYIGIFPED